MNISSSDKALYFQPNTPAHQNRIMSLRASSHFAWVYIMESLLASQNASNYEHVIDDDFSSFRDIYDRDSDSHVDVLRSMFRFMNIFTGIRFPSVDDAFLTSIPLALQNKLNNLNFEFNINRTDPIPQAKDKLWKFIHFAFLVQRGVIIRDNMFFQVFDTFKPPMATGTPSILSSLNNQFSVISRVRSPFVASRPWDRNVTIRLPCILKNASGSIVDSNQLLTLFEACKPDVASLNDSTAKGIFLLRQVFFKNDKSIESSSTVEILRIAIDAFQTSSPVVDVNALVTLTPYQVIAQNILEDFSDSDKMGSVEINTHNILSSNKSNDLASPATFFHLDYKQNAYETVFLKIIRILSASIKNNLLVADFQVQSSNGTSRSADFMASPSLSESDLNISSLIPLNNNRNFAFLRQDIVMASIDINTSLILTLKNKSRS